MAILKGIHLTHPLIASAAHINALGANWWCGTDEVLRIIRDPAQQAQFEAIAATYVYRIPHDASVGEIQAVRQLSNFQNEFIVLNEPDLWNITPTDAAALATVAIQNIQAADPLANNKIVLCMGSQTAGSAYMDAMLAALSPAIRALLDGAAIHFYTQADPTPGGGIYDENRLRNYLTWICPYLASKGFTKVWLSEFGWSDGANPIRVANNIPKFAAVMQEFPILKRWNYYCANGAGMTPLVTEAGLTEAGQAFASLN